jgi:hypothetical protein
MGARGRADSHHFWCSLALSHVIPLSSHSCHSSQCEFVAVRQFDHSHHPPNLVLTSYLLPRSQLSRVPSSFFTPDVFSSFRGVSSSSYPSSTNTRVLFAHQHEAFGYWLTRYNKNTLFVLSDLVRVASTADTFATVLLELLSRRTGASLTLSEVERRGNIDAAGVHASTLGLRIAALLGNEQVDCCNLEHIGLVLAFCRRVTNQHKRFLANRDRSDVYDDDVKGIGFLPGPAYVRQVKVVAVREAAVQDDAMAAPPAAPEPAQDEVPSPPLKKRAKLDGGTPTCSLQVSPSSPSDGGVK